MALPPLLLFLLLPLLSLADPVLVSSPRGSVFGFHVDLGSDTSKLFYGQGDIFLGIPYSQSPVGERRFKLPQPLCLYDGKVNATEFRPRCPQKKDPDAPAEFSQSEDCLFLNVFTPDASSSGFPVMVYIHGGGLTTGGADEWGWKGAVRNLVSRGVVVVTFQYRLGLLGFLTSFTADLPPNRGIYDQMMALRWVQEEIEYYGGDSGQVTVFGHSAGGISASALSLTPLARGLFHRVIQQSGSILTAMEIPDDPRGSIHKRRAFEICKITESEWKNDTVVNKLLDCFSNRTLVELTTLDGSDDLSWNVGRDGSLLPSSPSSLALSRPHLPTLMGDVRDETAYFSAVQPCGSGGVSLAVPQFTSLHNLSSFAREGVPLFLLSKYPYLASNLSMVNTLSNLMVAVAAKGPLEKGDHRAMAEVVIQASSALLITAFARRDAQWRIDSGHKETYLYRYNYPSSICRSYEAEGWQPVGHAAELCFLWLTAEKWEAARAGGKLGDDDYKVADNVAKAWTDFAKEKNPGWIPTTKNAEYMVIDEKMDKVERGWREDEHVLYNKVFPELLGEFPSVSITKAIEEKLKLEGAKILTTWNTELCTARSTITRPTKTSTSSSKSELTTKSAFSVFSTINVFTLVLCTINV